MVKINIVFDQRGRQPQQKRNFSDIVAGMPKCDSAFKLVDIVLNRLETMTGVSCDLTVLFTCGPVFDDQDPMGQGASDILNR